MNEVSRQCALSQCKLLHRIAGDHGEMFLARRFIPREHYESLDPLDGTIIYDYLVCKVIWSDKLVSFASHGNSAILIALFGLLDNRPDTLLFERDHRSYK